MRTGRRMRLPLSMNRRTITYVRQRKAAFEI